MLTIPQIFLIENNNNKFKPRNNEFQIYDFFNKCLLEFIMIFFCNWQTEKKNCFGPMRSLFSFSTAQTEKKLWRKLWKTRFVVWWFDPMSSLQD